MKTKRKTIILYHRAAYGFPSFDATSIGRGGEPNTALGLLFIENPAQAADYAEMATKGDAGGGAPRVLIV